MHSNSTYADYFCEIFFPDSFFKFELFRRGGNLWELLQFRSLFCTLLTLFSILKLYWLPWLLKNINIHFLGFLNRFAKNSVQHKQSKTTVRQSKILHNFYTIFFCSPSFERKLILCHYQFYLFCQIGFWTIVSLLLLRCPKHNKYGVVQ